MSHSKSLNIVAAIVYGGLVAGVLDATDGVITYYFAEGLNPVQVLQYIASGFWGAAAFQKGLDAALVGLVAHFFIALVVAAIYIGASRIWRTLRVHTVGWGVAYGAAVYLAMNLVILPQTAVVRSGFSPALFLNGIIGHALFVGLPIALTAQRVSEPVSNETWQPARS